MQAKTLKLYWLNCNPADRIFLYESTAGDLCNKAVGEDQIVLTGEDLSFSENKIKILTPDYFLNDLSQYDLIVNIDSLTEMDISTMQTYLHKIQESTPVFLSINHEVNKHSGLELISSFPGLKYVRNPYWMRNGYVEELYRFNK